MMLSNIMWKYAFLAISAPLTSASHLSGRQQSPYPPSTFSKGFKLIANVTDRAHDLSPSIHGWALQGAHIGADLNSAVLNNTTPGTIFYQNGTANEIYHQTSNILTDSSTPLAPYGLIMRYPNETSDVVALGINGGSGTPGITLTNPPYPMTELSAPASQFVACKEKIPYYPPGWEFVLVRAFRDGYQVPANCAVVDFLPQCAELPDLPPGSYSTHEFANLARCFEDPAGIDWSKYPEVR
ncbi:uncharacterized protein GGS22DRAFT_81493 [Annulohypoxylon maeteangense]|uniref:uncharacterized protein n=1 Tax=Annulohypoxylon maeteangense TaxID=1927788 RepID=UPI002008BF12|nr:uncharacterized protein GGS22DRAFT_81493 [Annulohypoxylon maeteangense]KAI0880651.1 hypothetical protein GGS22DRAFT_81493 [Annulohypoxylon maeteangense]